MAFRILVARTAQREFDEAWAYIAVASPGNEAGWGRDLLTAIASLDALPLRFPLAREPRVAARGIRQLLVHSHRVLYRVDGETETVVVLRIVHQARRDLA